MQNSVYVIFSYFVVLVGWPRSVISQYYNVHPYQDIISRPYFGAFGAFLRHAYRFCYRKYHHNRNTGVICFCIDRALEYY